MGYQTNKKWVFTINNSLRVSTTISLNKDFTTINNPKVFTTTNSPDFTTNNNNLKVSITKKKSRKQQEDNAAVNFAAAWKESEVAKAVMEAAKKAATAKVSAVMIANNHKPGATENRILA